MPRISGADMPTPGVYDVVVERHQRRIGTPGIDDAHFLWKLVDIRPAAKEQSPARTASPESQKDVKHAVPKRVYSASISEAEASSRAKTALTASASMVSGYLSRSGREHTKDYSWRDMVEISLAVADAFVDWMDDSVSRQRKRPEPGQEDPPVAKSELRTMSRIADEMAESYIKERMTGI